MDVRELYGVEEARFLLGRTSRASLYEILNKDELASVTIGRRFRYHEVKRVPGVG
jgi:hypothetical protein